jgi:cyclopropane-fatty-acyl-phospholipid synthase
MLLSALLRRVIHVGTLEVIDADGGRHVFSGAPGPRVAVRQHSRALHHRLYFDPDLHLGEAYMDGTLTIEAGTLAEFATLVASNLRFLPADPLFAARARLSRLLRRWQQFNPAGRARKNAAHHYDLPDRLYDLFLDRDRQYSWAYFRDPGEDLETAQLDKQRHLAAKLLLKPGQRVLDIGSGWGGLALHLARAGGGEVTGITLSEEQLKAARRRAAEEGLARRVRFHLRDYRAEAGTYDRIVSVGMFEHVGVNHYDQFFAAIARLLADDGVCVVHSIGRFDGPSTTSAWVRRHIFPGGYAPALSEALAAVERSGLWVTDVEILRLHSAETLRHWRQRFQASRNRVAEHMGERFCRMWEFYLAFSEAAFRHGNLMVFQLQLVKRRDAVPLTRDYIAEREAAQPAEAAAALPSRAA